MSTMRRTMMAAIMRARIATKAASFGERKWPIMVEEVAGEAEVEEREAGEEKGGAAAMLGAVGATNLEVTVYIGDRGGV